jgi:hypothetical protein
MTRFNELPRARFAALAGAIALAACGGGGGDAEESAGTGTMRVALTDAPACGYDHVYVTVDRVRVHQSAGAAESDGGWSEIVVSPARRVDLLGLTNGALEELGQTPLPAGTYTQMRLVLADNSTAQPMANSVVPTGGSEIALDTPSAQQSGLKMNVDVEVGANQVADVAIDFDACKSVVRRGNSGRYNLKPVLAVIPRLSDAGQRVTGYVVPALGSGATTVSLQLNGVPVRSTPPDATGRFTLYPVPPGTYDLVIAADGRATAVMTGVPVTASAVTAINTDTARIDLPASATSRTAAGTTAIANSSAVPDAVVHALQSVTGTTVEVKAQPVDATTGAFSLTLPAAAPVKTAYAAGAASAPVFAADAAAAGKYTLQATATGRAPQSAAVDLTSANSSTAFTFP